MVFYPQLTKFWIILIFKTSKDLALIRRLKLAKSILMASEGQASVGFQTAMIFGYM